MADLRKSYGCPVEFSLDLLGGKVQTPRFHIGLELPVPGIFAPLGNPTR